MSVTLALASALSLSGTRFGYSPFHGMDIGWGNGDEIRSVKFFADWNLEVKLL